MEWKNLYRGFVMGISDLIPGVSGGTIAVILGIYDRLLTSISGFFSKEWKRHLGFLLPLGLGMLSAILLLSRVIEYLLTNYHEPTQFFFLGLIVGVVPFMIRQADVKQNFKLSHFIVMIVAIILLAMMAVAKTDRTLEIGGALTFVTIAILFFSGWLASMAMLLPGISGSFVLLVIGVYPVVISALSALDIPIIMIVGAGVVVGFIVSSKGIKYALAHFPHVTYAAIIGLIIGSIFVVFPGVPTGGMMIVSILTFLAGLLLVVFLGAGKRV